MFVTTRVTFGGYFGELMRSLVVRDRDGRIEVKGADGRTGRRTQCRRMINGHEGVCATVRMHLFESHPTTVLTRHGLSVHELRVTVALFHAST